MRSTDYDFVIADVFTRTPFGGNQLAVFPDATGLPDATMQSLAREFNFSETTFVLPPSDPSTAANTRRLRIFTPRSELPFAGHPTVGTASVLTAAGYLEPDGGRIILEEGVGPILVELDGAFSRFTVTAPLDTADGEPSAKAVAAALTLDEHDILDRWYAGIGLHFLYVHARSQEAVDRIVLDKPRWAAGVRDGWSPHMFVFAGEPADGARLHARSFVPAIGIEEDPATGSACAGLVASLAGRAKRTDGDYRLHIDQGVLMGRPSQIEATAHLDAGRLTGVSIAGYTTIVGRGTVTLELT